MSSTLAVLKSKESTKKWEFYRGFSPSSTSSESRKKEAFNTDSPKKRHFSTNDSLFYMFSQYDREIIEYSVNSDFFSKVSLFKGRNLKGTTFKIFP